MKMKNHSSVIQALICLIFFGFPGFAEHVFSEAIQDSNSGDPAPVNWNRVKNITWQLVSINKDRDIRRLKYEKNIADGMKEIYTLRFTDDTGRRSVNGRGAPNMYFGVLEAGDHNAIGIGSIVSTKMAPLFELHILKENEFFRYLQKAFCWSMDNYENLRLVSKNEEGEEVSLIFKKIEKSPE